jgi:chromosomal replication initiator protein
MPTSTPESTLWNTVKSHFQGLFPYDTYRTWFEHLNCAAEHADNLVLSVPNEFAAIWIQDNYQDLITRQLSEAAGRPMQVSFQVSHPTEAAEGSAYIEADRRAPDARQPFERPPAAKLNHAPVGGALSPRSTFENFVVGSGNELAQAAAVAVANTPARAYNPLFIYGETGLGKTHLMHAIAHHVSQTRPDACIAYLSSENFTNQYIEAIQTNTVARFRQRYRKVDILLVDDIQFLEGKERIQEEFFHTFNALFEQFKQIVLTSDRPAGEIARLESRLLSRFQWGLVADVSPPDFETRLAILRKKAQAMQLELADNILQYLAQNVTRNVRWMEGALTRVASYHALKSKPLELAELEELLKELLVQDPQEKLSIQKIQKKVAEFYKVELSALVGRRRHANIVLPRHISMHLSRLLTSHSLQEIGNAFDGRDHGTVIHANRSIETLVEQDEDVAKAVNYLMQQLKK